MQADGSGTQLLEGPPPEAGVPHVIAWLHRASFVGEQVDLLYPPLLPLLASRNFLLYQSLPTHTPYRHALPTVSLDVMSLMASSCRYYRGKSRHALRRHARCPWRHNEGARHVDHTAIRRTRSPWRPCRSVPADGHGCPRGVAPRRHPLAIRDIPMARTGAETPPSPHHATGCGARPSLLFSPPGPGFSTLEARWKPWIGQSTGGIMRGDTVGLYKASAVSTCAGSSGGQRHGTPWRLLPGTPPCKA